MKKVFAIIAIAAFAACNSASNTTPAADTTKKDTVKMSADTTKKADTAKMAADTTKKM
jgi:hypothetical protein